VSRRRTALADDTNARIVALVENSAPDLNRPRLTPARELRLADVERRTAACYAGMEDLTYKVEKLTRDIEKGPPPDADERDTIRDGE